MQGHCWSAESSRLGTAQEQLFALAEEGQRKLMSFFSIQTIALTDFYKEWL